MSKQKNSNYSFVFKCLFLSVFSFIFGSGGALGLDLCSGNTDDFKKSHIVYQEVSSPRNYVLRTGCIAGWLYRLKQPNSNYESMCVSGGWPIPKGYVVTRVESATSSCPFSETLYRLRKLSSVSDSSLTICHMSKGNVTNPWTIKTGTYQNNTSQCGSSGQTVRIVKPTLDNNQYCSQADIRSRGYIVTRVLSVSSSLCLGGVAYQGAEPTEGATHCGRNPAPDGWYLTNSGTYSQCGKSGGGLGSKVYSFDNLRSGDTVCSFGPIKPKNGLVISKVEANKCAKSGYLLYTYTKPNQYGGESPVCKVGLKDSQIPFGFVMTNYIGNSSDCNGLPKFFIKNNPADGMKVCQQSPKPSGFSLINYDPNGGCSPFGTYTLRKNSQNEAYICENGTPESGFVKNQFISMSCPTGRGFKLVRPSKTYGQNTIVCGTTFNIRDQELKGFVIVKKGRYSQCAINSGGEALGFEITFADPSRQITVCGNSPVPDTMAVIKNGITSSACKEGQLNVDGPAKIIAPPSKTEPSIICSTQSIPKDFVITAVISGVVNTGLSCPIQYKIEYADRQMDICALSSALSLMPAEMIITHVKSSDQCGSVGKAYTIEFPDPNGYSLACLPSPIPDGFVERVNTRKMYSQCNPSSGASGTGFEIMPEGGIGHIPSLFINSEPDITSPENATVNCSAESDIDVGFIQSGAEKNGALCK